MQTYRSYFYKVSYQTVLVLAIVPLLFIGCAKSSDSETAGSLDLDGDFSVSIPSTLQKHRTDNLTAQLVVDGGTPIDMVVDLDKDTVSATVPGLAPGPHIFVINYFSNGALIATASASAEMIAGETVAVIFPPESLVLVDAGDGGVGGGGGNNGSGSNWNAMNWNVGTWS